MDNYPEQERAQKAQEIIDGLNWKGPWHMISAVSGMGLEKLTADAMKWVEQFREETSPVEAPVEAELQTGFDMPLETPEHLADRYTDDSEQ